MRSGTLGSVSAESESAMSCVPPASDEAKDRVCSLWSCGHAGIAAVSWDGDPRRCHAGRMDEVARDRALNLVNMYRALAGVPEVSLERRWETPAQECALLAHANQKLSHTPPPDWSCWSSRGARASAVSLVANRSAPLAIGAFIADPGNEASMVHRRWLLSEKVRRLGFGSTSGFACALVDGREFDEESSVDGPVEVESEEPAAAQARAAASAEAPSWVAWPPPGAVPIDAVQRTLADRTGWTVQSSSLDLDGASVTVSVDGQPKEISVHPLERTLGSLTAIRFVPRGWSSEANERYDVHVERGDLRIDFTVEPVSCPRP